MVNDVLLCCVKSTRNQETEHANDVCVIPSNNVGSICCQRCIYFSFPFIFGALFRQGEKAEPP